MHVNGSAISPFAAIASGVRGQFRAMTMQHALADAGALSPALKDGYEALDAQARSLTEAGLAAARHDLIGELLDITG